MEILIFGAGLVGKALGELAGARAAVLTSRDADIRSREAVQQLVAKNRPAWIVLSAAISDVDASERDPQRAREVNVGGAENVAHAAREAGARLMFISTDYVFDGEASQPYETDAPRRAVNLYGRTKIEAEDVVQATVPGSVVARTSWVFGVQRPCFGTKVLDNALAGREIPVSTSKRNCSTYNRDLAHMLLALIEAQAKGVFHCCNDGELDQRELAEALAKAAGVDNARIVVSAAAPFAPRPRYTPLSVKSLQRVGIQARPWRHAVPDFVAEYLRRPNG